MKMRRRKVSRKLEGRYVFIRWTDPEADWHWYQVLHVRPKRGTVKVQGIDAPGRIGGLGTFVGGPDTWPVDDIREVWTWD